MSHKYKLSQWHDPADKPVHIGVYENTLEGFYRKWNGKQWMLGSSFIDIAENETYTTHDQYSRWRGIVK